MINIFYNIFCILILFCDVYLFIYFFFFWLLNVNKLYYQEFDMYYIDIKTILHCVKFDYGIKKRAVFSIDLVNNNLYNVTVLWTSTINILKIYALSIILCL